MLHSSKMENQYVAANVDIAVGCDKYIYVWESLLIYLLIYLSIHTSRAVEFTHIHIRFLR